MSKTLLCRILAAAALAEIPLSAVAAGGPPQPPTNRASVLIATAAPAKTSIRSWKTITTVWSVMTAPVPASGRSATNTFFCVSAI